MNSKMKLGVNVLLCFLTVFCLNKCNGVTRYSRLYNDINIQDKTSNKTPLKTVIVTSSLACSTECMRERSCGTFFYNDRLRSCAIYMSRMSAVYTISPGNGWTFYHKNQNLCPLTSGYVYNAGIDRCVKVYDVPVKYVPAVTACAQENAALAIVDSYQMWAFVLSYLGNLNRNTFYIQGSKINGVWKWDDGTNIDYFHWGHGQPDNTHSEIHLVLWTADNGIHDVTGNNVYGYVCEVDLK